MTLSLRSALLGVHDNASGFGAQNVMAVSGSAGLPTLEHLQTLRARSSRVVLPVKPIVVQVDRVSGAVVTTPISSPPAPSATPAGSGRAVDNGGGAATGDSASPSVDVSQNGGAVSHADGPSNAATSTGTTQPPAHAGPSATGQQPGAGSAADNGPASNAQTVTTDASTGIPSGGLATTPGKSGGVTGTTSGGSSAGSGSNGTGNGNGHANGVGNGQASGVGNGQDTPGGGQTPVGGNGHANGAGNGAGAISNPGGNGQANGVDNGSAGGVGNAGGNGSSQTNGVGNGNGNAGGMSNAGGNGTAQANGVGNGNAGGNGNGNGPASGVGQGNAGGQATPTTTTDVTTMSTPDVPVVGNGTGNGQANGAGQGTAPNGNGAAQSNAGGNGSGKK